MRASVEECVSDQQSQMFAAKLQNVCSKTSTSAVGSSASEMTVPRSAFDMRLITSLLVCALLVATVLPNSVPCGLPHLSPVVLRRAVDGAVVTAYRLLDRYGACRDADFSCCLSWSLTTSCDRDRGHSLCVLISRASSRSSSGPAFPHRPFEVLQLLRSGCCSKKTLKKP